MSSVVAIVKSIVGQVFAVSPEGVRRVLIEGDRLLVGDQVDTGAAGAVTLELADGRTLDLGRDSQWSGNAPDSSSGLAEATAQAAPSVEELQQAIVAGADPTKDLEATAAGPAAVGTGGAAGGGHSFVMLDATAGRVDATVGFPTDGPDFAATTTTLDTGSNQNTTATNALSVLTADTGTQAEDSVATGNVLNNDSDADTPLSVASFTVAGMTGSFTAGQAAAIVGVGTLTIGTNGNYTFTPDANYNGAVPQVTYTTNTGLTSTLDLTVTAVDDPSVLTADTQTIAEDTPAIGNVLSNDSDIDNVLSVATFTIAGVNATFTAGQTATIANVGTLVIAADGAYTFTPAANYNGTVPTVSYTVTDGSGSDVTSTLNISVTPVDDSFTDASETVSGLEDAPVTGSVLSGTSSVDGPVSVVNFTIGETTYAAGSTATIANVGTLVIAADGAYTFTPAANYNGTVPTVSYTVTDGSGTDVTSTLNISVTPVDDSFTDLSETVTTSEDAPVTGSVLSGTSSVDGPVSVVNFTIGETTYAAGSTATIANVGTLVLAADGAYTFTPAANYNGTVPTVSYTVTDGSGTDVTSTLNISVTPVDDSFTDLSETVTTSEDAAVTGSVLAGTSSVDGPVTVLNFTIGETTYAAGSTATIANVGTLVLAADGAYTFTPAANYNGTVPTVSYTVTDGSGTDATSTLNISVTPVDDSFTDLSETVTTSEDAAVTGSVLAGTSSVDGPVSVVNFTIGETTYAAGSTATIANVGTLVLAADGAYTFTPAANYNGTVPTVSYTVTDGSGTDATSTLNISVTPVDDSFTDLSETVTTSEDAPVTGSALSGTSSVDGPVSVVNFTIGETTYAAGSTATIANVGTLVIAADGAYTFTPAANYNGTVPSVSYTVTDGSGTDVTSTLNISVTPVDDSFTDANESRSTLEDTALTGSVLDGTSSVDGPVSVLNFTVGGTQYLAGETATITNVGTLVLTADGAYTFTPAANYNGTVPTVSYTVTDGSGTDVTSTLNISVTPVDDSFTDLSETVTTSEDAAVTGSVLAGTSSVDGPVSVVNFTIGETTYAAGSTATIANVGTLVIGANGAYTFTPAANYNGTVPTVSYTVTDGSGTDVTSTLNISVTPVDDSFTDLSETVTTSEDAPVTGSVLSGTSSVDGPVSVVNFTIGETTYAAGSTATIANVGTLVIAADGAYTFTPAANYNGTVPTVSYTVTDGSGTDVTSTLNISVTPVDDSFTDANESRSTLEDTALTGSVLDGTSSVDGPVSVLNFTVGGTQYLAGETATITNVGTLVIGANGAYTFTPAANYNGTVPTVSYTVTDGSGTDVTSTLNISVTPVDDSFTDLSETVTTSEDAPLTGSVLSGTSSVDGPVTVLNFTIGETTYAAGSTATIANVGTLVIAADGAYTFTPAANYNGAVPTVSYTVTDGSGTDVTSTLNISVTPVDDSFTDLSETVTTSEDAAVTGSVLAGTSSVDGPVSVLNFTVAGTQYQAGETATITNVGTLVLTADGAYTFTPAANYNGTVPTVSYTVTDGSGTDATSTLNISVTPVDDSFTDLSETVTTSEDAPVTGSALSGTSSVDGPVSVVNFTIGETTYAAGSTATIANVGTLVIAADGAYTFTPAANYNGTVPSVSYTVTDGSGTDVTSTLNISVTPVDDSFTDANESRSTLEDTALTGSVLDGTSSVDGPVSVLNFTVGGTQYLAGETATITNVGTLVLTADGAYTFTPAANYNGTVPTVSYTVTDGSGTDVTSTLNISVTPVDDSFTDLSETVTTSEDAAVTGSVLAGTSSVDGPVSVVNFTIGETTYAAGSTATIANVGTLVIGANGAYTFTPAANYNGTVPTVSYTVTDGSGTDVTSTLNISVTPVDDSFTDLSETVTTSEDAPVTGSVLSGTSSVDGPVSVVNFTIGETTYAAGSTATIANVGTLVIAADGAYTFTPAANYNGTVPTVSYTVTDGSGTDVTSTLNISVTPVDDSFTDLSETVTTSEDAAVTGSVLAGTSSVDGPVTVLNFTVGGTQYLAGETATITNVGTLVIAADGAYTFTPAANYNGTVPTVSYTVTDGSGTDVTSTLNISVTPVDDSFTDANESRSTLEDTALTGSVLDGTSSVDGPVSVLNFTVGGTQYLTGETATITNVGTLVIAADGAYTFTPAANYNGTVPTVSYTVTDGSGTDVTSTLNISVTPVDDSFTDLSETVTTSEDAAVTGSVLAGTSSVDGPVTVLNFTVGGTQYLAGETATITNVGTLVIAADGAYTFTPAANYNGTVPTVSYTVTDGSGTDVTSTLNISVTPVDDSFTDANESRSTLEDTALTGSVLDGTSSVDGPVSVLNFTVGGTQYLTGETATITNVGTLVIGANGAYTFTPAANYNGTVPTVSYTVTDGSGTDVTSTLNISVTPVDDSFTDANESRSTLEDTALTGSVLDGTSSVDGPVSVLNFTVGGTQYLAGETATITNVGTLVIGANGAYTFTPAENYNGTVPTVSYTVTDGSGTDVTSTLNISVTPVDDSFTDLSETVTTSEDAPVTGSVLDGTSSVDGPVSVLNFTVGGTQYLAGETATITNVGTLVLAADGAYTFTPAANYNGTVPTVSYTVTDGSGTDATSTLNISVTPVDDSFTDLSETVTTSEDAPVTGSVLSGTSSVDGPVSVVNFTIGETTYAAGSTATIANVGTLVLTADGAYTFTPAANYNGTVPTVSYTVTDGSGTDATSTLNISVTPVDDSFTDLSETVTTSEDAAVTGSVLAGTSSVDGPVSVLNFTVGGTQYQAGETATITNVGTLVIGANGAYTFTPAENYNGTVPSVTYTVTDGSGTNDTSTLNISVTPVDDSFTDLSETVTTSEDAPVTGSVLSGTSSVDGPVSVVNFTIGETTYAAGSTATIANVGTLVLTADGAYTFTPAANYNGTVPTVSYTVTDGSGTDATSTLNISVTPVDDSFTDLSETVTTSEDAAVTGSVLAGTSSVDGPVTVLNFTVGGTQYLAGETATITNVGTLVIAADGAYTFTPAANYNGTVPTVSYTVTDGSGTDVTSTLNISVTPVDDSFTDANESRSTLEDTALTGSVLDGTSSVDGPVSVLNFTVGGTQYLTGETATITNVGTLVIGANGAYTFTPAANYNGTVPTVSYTVTDGSGTDVTSTLNISVTPVDDSFTDANESRSTLEDTALTGSVLDGTSSVDGPVSVLNFTVGGTQYLAGETATITNVGTLVIGANGAYTFTPAENYNGTVPTVSYTVTDGSGTDVTSTLNISVTPVDDSFTDLSETVTTSEDAPVTGSVLDGTSSVDGPVSVLNFTVGGTQYLAGETATITNVGTLVLAADGAYTFTPAANYNGTVPTVSYTVTDGSGTDATSTLNISVTPVDDSFTDLSETVTTSEDAPVTGSVLSGTSSVDGPVSVVNFTIGETTYAAGSTATIANVGTLVLTADGAYTFTPAANYNGTVPTVSYTVTDGSGTDATSTLNISVTPVDDSFTDLSETVTTSEDAAVTGSVLAGTSSVDGPVSVLNFTVGGTQYQAGETATITNVGTLVIGANGAYTFTPAENYNGTVPSVTYTVTDGSGTNDTSTLNISVTPVDDSFTDLSETVTTSEDAPVTGSVLSGTSSVDGPVSVVNFTIGETTYAAGSTATIANVGTLVLTADGAYTFTPAANYNGTVPTVSYTVTDGSGTDATSTLNISVTPVDDSFTDLSETVTTSEDAAVTGSVLAGTSSVDGPVSVLNFTVGGTQYQAGETATITNVGTLVIGANGAYTFTPAENYNGTVPSVTYTVTDGSGTNDTSTLNISVTPVDDSFTDLSETVTTSEDAPVTGSVLDGTSSVDGPVSVLNFTVGGTQYQAGETATITNVGTLVIGANGAYTFTPAENYNGTVPTVSYTVTDGSGTDVTSTLNISVTPVDDSFTDASETVSGLEDAPVTGSVLDGTSSVDGPVTVLNFTIGETTYAAGSTATIANVGTLVIGANGAYTFTPAANYNGTVPTVSYTVTDGSGTDVTSTLNISVTPVDDSFTDASETVSGLEDAPVTGSVLDGTSSVDGPVSVLNFTVGGTQYQAGETATITNVGTLVIGANGAYTFTPAENYNGTVPTVSYTVTDGSGTDVTSTLNISVTPVDDSFTDASETVSGLEDAPVTGSVLDGTSSVDGPVTVLNFTIGETTYAAGSTATIANVGTLVIGANGAYTFTPAANYNGTVPTVSYTVTDGSGTDVTSTLNISVTPVDDSFTDANESRSTLEDTALTGSVLDGTSSVDGPVSVLNFTVGGTQYLTGETATITNVGTLVIGANGAYTFTPAANYNGTVPTVTYTVTDGSGTNDTSTLNISVTPVDDSFTDASETVSTLEDTALTGSVLTGTSSVDGPVSVVNFTIGATTYAAGATATITNVGTLVIGANGAYTFTPAANYNGRVPSVTYTVTDGSGSNDTSTLKISVTPVNDNFTDASETVTIKEDTFATGNVLSGTSSVDGPVSVLNFTVGNITYAAGAPAIIANVGLLVIWANGVYAFTPAANYNGTVPTVSYTVTDGSGTDVTSTLNISVTPVNDNFIDASETVTVNEDTVATGNVLTGTSSVDGPVSVVNFTIGATTYAAGTTATIANVGTLVIGENGAYTFTPNENYNGSVPTVSYTVTDGSGGNDTSTLNISVTPVNDNFIDASETVTINEDTVATGNVLTGTSSVDGPVSVVNFTIGETTYAAGSTATIANVGTLVIGANGAYTFTPATNYNGTVPSVTYTVTDGSGSNDTSTLNISVTPVDDSFTDASETVSTLEDTAVTGSILDGTSSVDGPVSVLNFTIGETTYAAGSTATIANVGTLVIGANGTSTFTPAANYNGTVPKVSYTVTDGSGSNVTSTLDINVTPVNDPSVLTADTNTVDEDHVATGNVLGNDSDVDNDLSVATFTVQGVTGSFTAGQVATIAGVGTVTIAANGDYSFTPTANWNGTAPQISYTTNTNSISTLDIAVNSVNDAPTVSTTSASGDEDQLITVQLGGNDIDGSVDHFSLTSLPANGVFYADAAGTIALTANSVISATANGATIYFKPTGDWSGTTNFTYSSTDNQGMPSASSATGTIVVAPITDTPSLSLTGGGIVVSTDLQEVALNGAYGDVDVSKLGNGAWHTDNNGSRVEIGKASVYGAGTDNQVIELERNAGDASNLYTTIDAKAGSTYNVSFDYAPRAGVDNSLINVYWGGQLIGTLNTSTTGMQHYSFDVPVTADGNQKLEFRAGDSNSLGGLLDNINVTQVLNSGLEDNAILLSTIQAHTNDADGSETLTITLGDLPTGSSLTDGTHTFNATDGSTSVDITGWGLSTLKLTPPTNFNGDITLTVTATAKDGDAPSASTSLPLVVHVAPVDDASVLQVDQITVDEDHDAIGNVLTNDHDIDNVLSVSSFSVNGVNGSFTAGQTATITGVGTLIIASNGDYTFKPAADWNGNVPQVTYTTSTGSSSTLNISVTPVDDSFTDANESRSTLEDTALSGSVLDGTSSVDGPVSVVNFTVGDTQYLAGATATIANVGTLVIGANGAYTFTPAANYNGTVPTVTYTVTDGSGTNDTSTLNISVTPVDDSFTDANELRSTLEDTALTGSVLEGTSSVDGPVSVVNFTVGGTQYLAGATATIANVGTLVIGANGAYTFTPAANYNGTVPTVTYTVTDGSGTNDTSTLNISVTPVDDSFTDANESRSTLEDTALTGSVLDGTSSVDGPVSVLNFTVGGTQYLAGETATIANVGTLVIGANGAYTFTPAANYNGTVPTVTYTVTDGSGTNDTSTLNISVTPVDDSFSDANELRSTLEDTALTGSVLEGTSSVDGPVSVVNFTVGGTQYLAGATATIANVGTLVIGANGAYTFTPAANYNGTVPTVTYTVTDGSGTNDTSTLNISVTPVDDSFSDANESRSTLEDTALTGSVLDGTSSVDGPVSVLNFTVGGTQYLAGETATITNVGTLVIGANGAYTFTPAANYNGTVPTVTYTVTDGSGTNDTSTLNISVTPVDDSFTDANESRSTLEDTALTGSVLEGTSSADGPVSVVNFTVGGTQYLAGATATIANVGTLVIGANGAYTFTPAANYNGTVPTVTYTVTDGSGTNDTSTLNISVTPVDDSFSDANELRSTLEDTALSGSVLDGTSSVDGPVSVVNFTVGDTQYLAGATATIANVGTLVIGANGAYTFTPAANYNGTVPTVTYTVTDGSGTNDTSTLNISVTPVDDSFTDANELRSTLEDTALTGSVLEGTSSVDGPVSVVNFTVGGTQYLAGATATIANVGTLVIGANGAYTFTPAANYNGTVPTVTYTVTDGSGTNDTSTLNISVTPVDDSFTDANESRSTLEDTALTGSVLDGTSSVDGPVSVLNFTVGGTQYLAGATATIANVGTLVIGANGAYTFTPAANYNGTVPTVTYTVTDGSGTNDTSTLNISVTPVDDSFSDANELRSTLEDTALTGSVLEGTSSVDGPVSVVNFTVGDTQYLAGATATIANVGTLVIGANGAYTFTPAANYNGTVPTVSYTVTDGSGGNDTSTLNISVTPVDDSFTDANESRSTLEDTALTGSVLEGTSSVDGPVSVVNFTVGGTQYLAGATATIANVGTLVIGANGAYTFTPAANYNGTVPTVTYTVTDGSGTNDTSTLNISVTPVNDAPTAAPVNVTGTEDTPLILGWSTFGVSDVDSPAASLGVKITGLPGDGKLQYLNGSTWTDLTPNQTITKADIDAGKLRFMPDANESGANGNPSGMGDQKADYAQIQFQPTDGALLGNTGTIKIDITPVADAPTLNVASNNVTSTGLIKEAWTGLAGLGTNGNGAPTDTLKSVIDAAGKANSSSTVTNVQSSGDVAAGTASKTSGLIYLEAGKTYTFSGTGDDSLLVTIGGKNVASALWGNGGAITGTGFVPTTSGYYTIDIYHHNQSGPGSYDVNLSVNGGTAVDLSSTGVPLYSGVADLAASGVTVSDLHGTNGEGYYDGYKLNTGAEGTSVHLSAITTVRTDVDGSESLGVKISGIPAGAVLTDGAGHTFTATATSGEANVTDWTLSSLTVTPPAYYNGQFNLTVTSTSTESLGGSAASVATIPITVYPAVYNPITGTAGNDNVVGTDGNDIVVADIGGLTVIPGQNYNIAFMVDSSGSMSASSVTSAKNSLIAVFTSLIASATSPNASAGTVKVFLVDFDTQVNKSISIDLSKAGALDQLKGVLNSMQSGGYTNYEDVFKTTANWFKGPDALSNSNATNLTYFITDGEPTAYTKDEQTNPLVVDFKSNSATDLYLDNVLKDVRYTPGTEFKMVIGGESRVVIDTSGVLYKWSENSKNEWSSKPYSSNLQVHAQGDGTFELSDYAGSGDVDSTSASNAATAFALFAAANSKVQAIGVNSDVSEGDLSPYNTANGKPLANINPDDLANAILGHSEATLPGKDTINGGDGNDIIFGDLVSFTGVTGEGYTALQAFVGKETGIETNKVTSSNVHQYVTEHYSTFDVSGAHDGDDTLLGGAGNDIIFGQGGDDKLYGGSGNDILLGGTGNDLLNGEAGNDFLIGGAGTDTLDGGAGNDTLLGGSGNDTLIGGLGGDTFVWKAGDTGTDVIKDFNANEGDRIDLRDLLQNESGSTIDNFLKITTSGGVSSLEVNSAGNFNSADATAAKADVTIKLEGNNWSTANLHNLIAGSDPTIKVDHNNS